MMRGRIVAVLLLLLAAVTACAQVPSGSDPIAVRSVNGHDDTSFPKVYSPLPGPKPGARIDQIVSGFLDAESGGGGARHQLAREFLTPDAATDWNDGADVTVYNQRFIRPARKGSTVTVILQRLGTVDTEGSYRVHRGTAHLHFDLKKVKGEWRIANPPSGVAVQSNDFSTDFHRTNVYFLGAGDVVVPDPRYFRVPAASLANRVMQALVDGPSRWLAPAVRTDVPKGAKLRRNVLEDSPVTTVDLANLGSMTSAALKGLSAQIVWTLSELNTTTVQIRADGQPLEVPGVGQQQSLTDWEAYDPDALPASASAYVVYNGSVWNLDGNRIPGPAGTGAYDFSSVDVSSNNREMAGIAVKHGRDHMYVGRFGHLMHDRLQAHRLTRPTWGSGIYGTWTVRNGSDVIRIPDRGEPQVVSSPAVAKVAPVTAMRLSRDGTRAAIIGKGGRLYIGRVSIASSRMTIDGLRAIAPDLRDVKDVAWSDADTLSVLASNSSSYPVVTDVAVDGSEKSVHSNINNLPGVLTGIAAAPGRQTLGSADGTIWQLIGNGWSRVIARGDTLYGQEPTYPD